MQSYYEINVSKDGKHYFATAPRSCTTFADTNEVYQDLAKFFTKEKGFVITVTYWEGSGSHIAMNG